MRIAAHQPQFMPWPGYFHKMASCDLFVYLDDVQYKKREFQNRNKIRAPGGWTWLTVPVETKSRYEQKISEVVIDNARDWRREHIKSLKTNYARAAHYGLYIEYLENLYNKPWQKLAALNVETAGFLAARLNVTTPVRMSSELGVAAVSTRRLVDICLKLGASEYLSGAGARDYLDEKIFDEAGIKVVWQEFRPPVYRQVFDGFEPYMSALDILLNEGPSSAGIVTGRR